MQFYLDVDFLLVFLGLIRQVEKHSAQLIYTRATKGKDEDVPA